MLVPVTFLNKWSLRSAFGSLIGFDKYGLKIREHLSRLEHVDWSGVIQDKAVQTDHSYVVTYSGVRTIYDLGNSSHDHRNEQIKVLAEKMIEKLLPIFENPETKPRLIYLSKWLLKSAVEDLLSQYDHFTDSLIVFETGTRGELQATEKLFAPYCDVVLASSLYVMRALKMPIYGEDATKRKLHENIEVEYKDGEDRTIRYTENMSVMEWTKMYDDFCPENYTNMTHQTKSFILGLKKWGLSKFMNMVFPQKASDNALGKSSLLVITLGEIGMMAFSKDLEYAKWFKIPSIGKVMNTLGCGDVARAGFIASFLKDSITKKKFLNNENAIDKAIKRSVAAGSMKAQYFTLEVALENMSWESVDAKAWEVNERPLNDLCIDDVMDTFEENEL